jgi:uncharacterized membrane protein YhaH (DUF805 family)
MIKVYVHTMKTIFDNEGRSSRKELGVFLLFNFIIPLSISNALFKINNVFEIFDKVILMYFGLPLIYLGAIITIVGLPFIIIKRLHDAGKNGWNILLPIVPLGIIWFLYLILLKSENGDNKYGKMPLIL